MEPNELLASKLQALLGSDMLPKDVAAILQLAAATAHQQPDLTDPLPFRDHVRKVSLAFRELYGDEAIPHARRVAAMVGNSALARVIVNDLEWFEREQARLAALAQYDILDTPSEPGFDDLVLIASHVCQTPIALVSLVESHRQWFKAAVGIEMKETVIKDAVCIHTIDASSLLVIPDLTQDPRTRDNPLVRGTAHIRFYAAAPLTTPAGITIGALCVIDREPRPEGLTAIQAQILQALARQAIVQLELKRISSGATTTSRTNAKADA